MADVLVVFGSSSDSRVYEKVMQGLKQAGIAAELRICSAHRTPQLLEEIVAKSSAKLVIAGAGLSAALPGAIAAKTAKPVIGVPVSSNYAGLDALLSTVQMPSGFPVLAVGVDAAENAAEAARLCLQKRAMVKVVGNSYNKVIKARIDKAGETAKKLGLQFEFIENLKKGSFNPKNEMLINVVEFGSFQPVKMADALVLNVPVLKESHTPEALEFFKKSRAGLWLGLNRVDNAFIAAAELLDLHTGKYGATLAALRKDLAKKTMEADAKEKTGA